MAYGNYRNNFDDYSDNITNFYGYGYNDYGDDEDEQLYIKLQPFSIFFLLFYIVLIVTQFICMLWHRLIPRVNSVNFGFLILKFNFAFLGQKS